MEDKKERLSKVEAAERQLKEAIRLFFEKRDSVAIHTLVCSSHQVLYDLCKKRGILSLIKDSPYIKEEKRKEVHSMLNKPWNFFKHADKDGHDILDFYPDATVFDIYDCTYMYHQLQKDLFAEAQVFKLWFELKFPYMMDEDFLAAQQMKLSGMTINTEDYSLFIKLIEKVKTLLALR